MSVNNATRAGWALLGTSLLLALVGNACTSCSSGDPPAAGGQGQQDAGADAAKDATLDRHRPDTGPKDAGHDVQDASDASDGTITDSGDGATTDPAPIWQKVAEKDGFEYEHLANPEQLRAFRWAGKASTWITGCEAAEFTNPNLTGPEHIMGYHFNVEEHGPHARFAFESRPDGDYVPVVFTDGDGQVIDAFRCRDPQSSSSSKIGIVIFPSVWEDHFALHCFTDGPMFRGLVGEFGKPSTYKPFAIDLSTIIGTGDGRFVMAKTRFGMRTAPARSIITFSNTDGYDPRVLDDRTHNNGVYELDDLDTTGDYFLWNQGAVVNGKDQTRIMYSDGIHWGKPLEQPPAGYDNGSIRNADTHLAWLRGSGFQQLNLYDHIELWASPFHGNPADLAPYKIADLPVAHNIVNSTSSAGGWGHFALGLLEGSWATVQIWNLDKKTRWKAVIGKKQMFDMAGITKTHLWIIAGKDEFASPSLLSRCPVDGPFTPKK